MDSQKQGAFIAWMPYFTVAYPEDHPKEIIIGRARLLPDDDESWRTATGGGRPTFLEIHRNFPTLMPEGLEVGKPLYGTLICSDDSAWLQQHIDSVTAVVFLLATTIDLPLPAECFTTLPLHLKPRGPETDDDLVSYVTKHSRAVESSQVLNLTPPLAVRACLKPRQLNVDKPWAMSLLTIIASAPYDRLVVATRQFFRSQFSDLFTSPLDEDVALHCSALEAALGIPRSQSGADSFARVLASRFPVSPMSETFFRGLYVARSLYVHGAPKGSKLAMSQNESAALTLFENTAGHVSLLRMVTREVLETELAADHRARQIRYLTPAESHLRKSLESDRIWRQAKKLLTSPQAGKMIGPSDFFMGKAVIRRSRSRSRP